jgi:hypothetical protein
MAIKLIQSVSEFNSLREVWNNLLIKSASDVPFLRHEYLTNWWKTLGGGEWKSGELAILIDQTPEGELRGIAPFFIINQQVLLLGSHEISDYLDLITTEPVLPEFVDKIITFMASRKFPTWNKMVFYNLAENSPTLPFLEKSIAKAGWNYRVENFHPAPSLELPGTWEAYLDQLDERYKGEILRKIRNAESYFLPVNWYTVTDQHQIDLEMDAFLDLMRENPNKKAFLTPEMVNQMKLTAAAAHQEGWLQLAFLLVGDIKVAGYLNFDYGGKLLVYNSGIKSLFENISPGWVLLSYLIRQAIQEGKKELDFMRGDEPYKYQFGGKDKQLLKIEITNH